LKTDKKGIAINKNLSQKILLPALVAVFSFFILESLYSSFLLLLGTLYVVIFKKYYALAEGTAVFVLLVTFLRSVGQANNTVLISLCIYVTLLFGSIQKREELNQKDALNRYQIFLIGAGILPGLIGYLRGSTEILRNMLHSYDFVGHFSMVRSLNSCTGFITKCENYQNFTPSGYVIYPQQWHIIAAPFFDDNELSTKLSSFSIIVTATLMFSLIGILFAFNCLSSFNQTENNTKIKNVFSTIIVSIIMLMYFYGYINYIFSISLLFLGIVYITLGTVKKFVIGISLLLLGASAYSLFFIPTIIFVITIFYFRKEKNLIEWISILVFIVVALKNILMSITTGQAEFISAESRSESFVIPILVSAITYVYLNSRENTQKSPLPLKLMHYSTVLFGSSVLAYLFIKNQLTGYFLYKSFVFLLLVQLFLIFIKFGNNSKKIAYILILLLPAAAIVNPMKRAANVYGMQIGIFQDDGMRELSSEIVSAANYSRDTTKSIIVTNQRFYFSSQWVNSLKGTWSASLEEDINALLLLNSEISRIKIFPEELKNKYILTTNICGKDKVNPYCTKYAFQ
jgi:hypothetical protein